MKQAKKKKKLTVRLIKTKWQKKRKHSTILSRTRYKPSEQIQLPALFYVSITSLADAIN
jgi:hypothetical protein